VKHGDSRYTRVGSKSVIGINNVKFKVWTDSFVNCRDQLLLVTGIANMYVELLYSHLIQVLNE